MSNKNVVEKSWKYEHYGVRQVQKLFYNIPKNKIF